MVDHRQGVRNERHHHNRSADTIPTEAERKLVRPAEGRVVAGVAAGLARYFGISPIVYRVAFAALILLGGSGFILYAAAWLVIPDEQRGESIVEEAIQQRRERPWLAIGVGLVGVGLILGLTGGRFWTNPDWAWLPALAVGLAILAWQLQDRVRAGPGSATPRRRRPEPVPARRRLPVFAVVLGILIAGAGVLGVLQATDAVDVNWTVALAGGVVLVGVGIAVGAFFGGIGALATVGAVLAAILVAVATIDVPLHGPIGDRTVHPATVLDVRDDLPAGDRRPRARPPRVEFPAGTTKVTASVGIGQLKVRVPDDVRVEVDADVTARRDETLRHVGRRLERRPQDRLRRPRHDGGLTHARPSHQRRLRPDRDQPRMTTITARLPAAFARLTRRRDERLVAGVCAGLARSARVDPTLVRLVFTLLALAGGAGLVAYLGPGSPCPRRASRSRGDAGSSAAVCCSWPSGLRSVRSAWPARFSGPPSWSRPGPT